MPAPEPNAERIADALRMRLGGRWTVRALGASSFCPTWQAQHAGERLFVKSAPADRAAPLQSEADGLAALAATRTIAVPATAAWLPDADGTALLALDWLDLKPPDAGFGRRFGEALAALHRAPPPAARFGWRQDNHLGATPQTNRPTAGAGLDDWLDFMASRRLGPLRDRLASAGAEPALAAEVDAVIAAMPALFDGPAGRCLPRPALIHGDLWQGNWGMTADGNPVIFDPAVSVSDPEAELAMMTLFGEPPAGFWPAYAERAGLHPDHRRRRPLYQLVHLLNHAVLFGGAYAGQARRCAEQLLRAAGS
jgi:fructosamine-3-kinase